MTAPADPTCQRSHDRPVVMGAQWLCDIRGYDRNVVMGGIEVHVIEAFMALGIQCGIQIGAKSAAAYVRYNCIASAAEELQLSVKQFISSLTALVYIEEKSENAYRERQFN